MKLLREYIKELLTESAINGKIMSMIDKAEKAGYKVKLFNASNGGSVYLLPIGEVRSDRALGTVDWRRPTDRGPCMQAKSVAYSKSMSGFGPLLYDVAIEASGGLMADRFSVSGEAEAVWDRYMSSRPDVTIDQLDILDDFVEPQLTPDDESDDCDQAPAYNNLKHKWHTSSLSKKYSKAGTPVIDELSKRGMLEDISK